MPFGIEEILARFGRREDNSRSILTLSAVGTLIFLAIAAILAGFSIAAVAFLILAAGIAVYRISRLLSGSKPRSAAGAIDWTTADPEIQRQQLAIAVDYLSRTLELGLDSVADLQSAFIVAEDLALRQIQEQEKCPVFRHISVFGISFDAVYLSGRDLVCIDVLFLVSPAISDPQLAAIVKKAGTAAKLARKAGTGLQVRLMLLVITQLTPEDLQKLRSDLGTARFSGTPVDIDIRFMDFEALQRRYICEQ